MENLYKVRTLIKENCADGLLVSSASNITYLTGYSNFSPIEREAYLLITRDCQYIITDSRYSEAVKNEVKDFQLIELNAKMPLGKLIPNLAKKHHIQCLGIEEYNLTAAEYKAFSRLFVSLCGINVGLSRSIKTPYEVDLIFRACSIGDKAFEYILSSLKPQITELELSDELEGFIKKQKACFSFPAIVAFGPHSSIPHHQTGEEALEGNRSMLLDFGARWKNYCSDMTRTIFWGKATDEQKKIYKTVLDAQLKAVEYIDKLAFQKKPIKASQVHRVSKQYIINQGFASLPHSLGHGIGLEVHEFPHLSGRSKETLEEGMVFSIEPGIYIQGVGGVRIEDIFVLEKNGLRQLTRARQTITEL